MAARRSPLATSKSERTRERILAAAEALFAERGFAGASVEEIAAHAGVRHTSLFYYFENKRELYETLLGELFVPFFKRIDARLAVASDEAPLIEGAIGEFVNTLSSRPTLARLLLRELVDTAPGEAPALLELAEPMIDSIRQLLAGVGREDVDVRRLVFAVSGAAAFLSVGDPGVEPTREIMAAVHGLLGLGR